MFFQITQLAPTYICLIREEWLCSWGTVCAAYWSESTPIAVQYSRYKFEPYLIWLQDPTTTAAAKV